MKKEHFVVPRLYCPFPSAVSPHLEAVNEHTLAWARRFGLVQEEQAFVRLRDSKFPSLIARAYPLAPRDRLDVISDWNMWLFLLDDECDEAGLGRKPGWWRCTTDTWTCSRVSGLNPWGEERLRAVFRTRIAPALGGRTCH